MQAVEFVRQGEHGLGEEGERGDVDGEFVGACAEEVAGDADVVAEVEQFVELEGGFADGVLTHVDLESFAVLLQSGEACLALASMGHDAAGDADVDVVGLKRFGGRVCELVADRGHALVWRERVAVGIGLLAQLDDFQEFVFALLVETLFKVGGKLHVIRSIEGSGVEAGL